MNAEPRGREVQRQAVIPSPFSCSNPSAAVPSSPHPRRPVFRSIANWNYLGLRALVAFFFAGLVVGFCLILRTDFFVMGAVISAISMPKTSASSVSLSALPVLGA